jgi:uncharacterized membrane protein YqhA
LKTIFKLIIIIPVLCSFIISLAFIGLGVYEAIQGIIGILKGQLHTEAAPGLLLVDSLDLFLIAFLFMIFSIGFAQLFIPQESRIISVVKEIVPKWLMVSNFTQLKLILWDTILTTLVVLFVEDIVTADGNYTPELMVIPSSILLIALSRYFIKKVHNE